MGDSADDPEILDLLKRSINLNELNEKSLSYLTSQNQSIFNKKDMQFIKDTFLTLGQGGMMSITSKNPTRRQYPQSRASCRFPVKGPQEIDAIPENEEKLPASSPNLQLHQHYAQRLTGSEEPLPLDPQNNAGVDTRAISE